MLINAMYWMWTDFSYHLNWLPVYFYVWKLLLQAEDDGDAKAASQAKAEEMAEMAEFDENFSVNTKHAKVSLTYCNTLLSRSAINFLNWVLYTQPC